MSRPLHRACNVLLILIVVANGMFPRPVSSASPAVAKQSPNEFTFVAAGDMLGPYKSTLKLDDPLFGKIVSIVRGADAAFANEEGNTFDLATFAGWPTAERTNVMPPHSLATARAFKEMGFNLLSRANNHATDWGVEGMLASDRVLDAIGIVHAGTGRSLEAARAPAYLPLAKGPVALIASASSVEPDQPAGDPSRGAGPRPGVNPLRVHALRLVTPEEMSTLRQTLHTSYLEDAYRVSDHRGVTYDVSGRDRADIINSITTAGRFADFVVYSIHAHEGCAEGAEAMDDAQPCDFLIPLFHDIVDAGADVVVRSGPHVVQGIEIYHGKPIFYGLGDFFMELPRHTVWPIEGWESDTIDWPAQFYESAIASSVFQNGVLSKITIYPLVVETQESSAFFGIPKLAQGADAHRILQTIQQRSALLGTKLEIVNGVGVIKGPGTP